VKYRLHMAYVNREDLAREAVESALDIGNIHLWPNGDNADQLGNIPGVTAIHRMPPMAPVSLINCMIKTSWDDDVMFWMHNDALALPHVANNVLTRVRELHASDKKWGVLWTLYDVLCAFNMKMIREVGYWDPMFFQYTADMDFYHRVRKAGWSIEEGFREGIAHRIGPIQPGDPTDNGSATVRSDPSHKRRIQFRESFDKDYYKFKWGGLPGQETFDLPFNGRQT
jgi:hypothetical protein